MIGDGTGTVDCGEQVVGDDPKLGRYLLDANAFPVLAATPRRERDWPDGSTNPVRWALGSRVSLLSTSTSSNASLIWRHGSWNGAIGAKA